MTTTTTRRVARYFALPVVSAGIIAGALGFAGAANAGTTRNRIRRSSRDRASRPTPRRMLCPAPTTTTASLT